MLVQKDRRGQMAGKGFTPEQIIDKLREAEIHVNQGISIAEASRRMGATQQTNCRWWQEYNQACPRSSLGYRPLAPDARLLVILS